MEWNRLGSHYAIDTGFIVFNDRTYPNFLKLLERIGGGRQPAEMSFSVKVPGMEYNGHNLDTLFARRRNLLSPRFPIASSPRSCASTGRRGPGWPHRQG